MRPPFSMMCRKMAASSVVLPDPMPEVFAQEIGKELLLKEALEMVQSTFEVAIIDSPPSLDLLAINTYAAADAVLIPVQTEFHSLEGLALMMVPELPLKVKRYSPPERIQLPLYFHSPPGETFRPRRPLR